MNQIFHAIASVSIEGYHKLVMLEQAVSVRYCE